ncbi:DUF3037 domain-containing protein [Roseibium porphyridii]|uniref:DUF3037 domain-containing protein n=1 Tax=Roseibium porphyridii TaxID=2866279 RepID=A0ABY8F7J6_9HYPH|nr:DUF3037 domain-containing protein [Roseibium sp. KMA01]WFE91467.1 DUF3037 domain-containing protein [Roseibium sp. KMA01]
MGGIGQYAILRFRPYPETGEFANVGIVVWAPTTRELAYKVVPKNFPRVRNFFQELETSILKETLASFEKELSRLKTDLSGLSEKKFNSAIIHFTRPRETIFKFSELRSIRIKKEINITCDHLYERFVGRSFVTKEYRERWMEKNIQETLKQHQLPDFTRQKIVTPLFPIDLPLVHRSVGKVSVIKPLAFDQNTASKMFDHGEHWNARFRALLDTGALNNNDILVPVEGPDFTATEELNKTYRYIRKELAGFEIKVVEFKKTSEIVRFVAQKNSAKPFFPPTENN